MTEENLPILAHLLLVHATKEMEKPIINFYNNYITIGRNSDSQVLFNSSQFSRRHAVFNFNEEENRWQLMDLSSNRILVNNSRVGQNVYVDLNDGDLISLIPGLLDYKFFRGPPASPSPPYTPPFNIDPEAVPDPPPVSLGSSSNDIPQEQEQEQEQVMENESEGEMWEIVSKTQELSLDGGIASPVLVPGSSDESKENPIITIQCPEELKLLLRQNDELMTKEKSQLVDQIMILQAENTELKQRILNLEMELATRPTT